MNMFPVDLLTLLAFIPAALALNLTPGADMMFCLAQGLRGSAKSAIAAAAGVTAGGIVHVALAGLGLGAIVNAHPAIFDVIRWVGVAYLLWLAAQALRQFWRKAGQSQTQRPALSPARAFRDGALVNLTNPKVILFTLAFIPQFIDPARGAILAQFLTLGVVIAIGGMIVNSAVGISASGLGRFASSARFSRTLGAISAGVFSALALRLALLEKA